MANYIVLEMDLNDKWWDKWFVVGGLSIDKSIQLNYYNYFNMSSVYMLTQGEDMAKKEFFVRKPQRNLKGFWSKLDIIGVIDDFGGLLSEVYKFCEDNIYCVTDPRVPEEDSIEGQNVFPLGTLRKSERMEKFLKENNFLFLMSSDVPFLD